MSEQNKALVRRTIEEIWNKGNLAVADELIAPNHVAHDPANPNPGSGPEVTKQQASMYRTAFPDLHMTIEDQVAEGDQVVTRWTATGTHRGDLMGIAPTGKQMTITGINISRIAGGKAQEDWTNWDTIGMMQQLGAVPQVAAARG